MSLIISANDRVPVPTNQTTVNQKNHLLRQSIYCANMLAYAYFSIKGPPVSDYHHQGIHNVSKVSHLSRILKLFNVCLKLLCNFPILIELRFSNTEAAFCRSLSRKSRSHVELNI